MKNSAHVVNLEAKRKAALDAYIKKVVAEAPPLTPSQRDRLAVLMRGSNAAVQP
jgi:hypothetical protein